MQCGLQGTGLGAAESKFDSQESGISLLPLQQGQRLGEAMLQDSQSINAEGSPHSYGHRDRFGL